MSEILSIKAEDAKGVLIKEFELELPTEFSELAILPGEAKALTMVRNQMKISARAVYKTHKGKPSIFPKGTQKEVREALKAGELSEKELLEFIRQRRAAK